jgi:hypothetical protein
VKVDLNPAKTHKISHSFTFGDHKALGFVPALSLYNLQLTKPNFREVFAGKMRFEKMQQHAE